MKILYIANARIPTEKAHGIQIMKMCEAFVSSGHDKNIELELIIPKRINYIKEDPFEYYGVKRNFEIKRFSCLDLITLDRFIGHLGLWIETITFSIFLFPYVLFKKADIIYTRDKFSLFLLLFKKNLFFEAHTFSKNYFLYSRFLKKLNRIIVITQKLKDLFIKRGIEADKILVAPDGVDLDKFDIKEVQEACRERFNLPLDTKIVLYTGHLYEWKGAQTLAEASQFLSKDIEVYFVGGTERDIKRFRAQNSEFRIRIIGHRPHSEIPYWLKAADVLVLPNSAKDEISKSWTSPIKMFEYMASKRPIVASDLSSIREILGESNAVLVKPNDPKSLSEGIKRILEDKDFAKKISAVAYENVQDYTWEKRVKNILKFIL
ncbi:MAG: glycosyltransferase family 4 protein [Patescibacteria group bacterium]|nr:glycosyltransferase family 4 protein [Patescibacteria group bacterium]